MRPEMLEPNKSVTSAVSAPAAPAAPGTENRTALLMLVLLSLSWGITWPMMKVALTGFPPFSLRTVSTLLGALLLLAFVRLQGRELRIPFGIAWVHLVVASIVNVVAFILLTTFAQIHTETSRVAILAYTMPIWAALFARPVLGERIDRTRAIALVLCVCGIAILIYPLAGSGIPGGLLLAAAAGVSWGAGTVYMKWAKIGGDPVAGTAWQLIVAFIVIAACLPVFEGPLHIWPVHWWPLFGLLFTGLIGSGLAYFLWFEIVRRVPAMTASLGVLSVPVVGVVSSVIILGDRPTLADIVGFALIFTASACVMLRTGAAAREPSPTS
jgi:drug/metabolite transporter (DMT)-like permease